jgi:type VI secretion system protein ImpJ
MANSEVHWHEGMFLRQHHFLTEHRQMVRLSHLDGKWDNHHNWGLRSIQLNTDALANFRFAIRSLKARLRDGTLVEVPEDGLLPDLDLKPVLASQPKTLIYLAVPMLRAGHTNVSEGTPAEAARYYTTTLEVEDENLGINPQEITLRKLNLRLLTSSQSLAGFDTLPIARIEKSERAEAVPLLDAAYIPPVVACDAWPGLSELVQSIYDRIGRKIERLAGQAVSRELVLGGLESAGDRESLSFAQLRAFNEAYATLMNLAFVEGIHPLPVYIELCRIVGQLSIFDPARRPPALPRYNHDDLGGCFHRVKNYLDALIDIAPEPDYEERVFVGRGLRMQVELEAEWLDSAAPMFLGVTSPLDAEACVEAMRQIDMKVGGSERVEMIYRMRDVGLQFAQVPAGSLPQALPRSKGLTFFQINRDLQQNEWQQVRNTRTLAIRFNEGRVVGNIDGQSNVTLRLASDMNFQFTLYVLARGGGSSRS